MSFKIYVDTVRKILYNGIKNIYISLATLILDSLTYIGNTNEITNDNVKKCEKRHQNSIKFE